jgi:hypothetical protein
MVYNECIQFRSTQKEAKMPRLVFHYKEGSFTTEELRQLGKVLKPLVAKFIEPDFTADDLDWMPLKLDPAADVTWPIQLDIETIGFERRISRLNEKAVRTLADKISYLPEFPDRYREWLRNHQAIWSRPQHVQGVHV